MRSGVVLKAKINLPFRLHFTLIAMHDCNYRVNGGVGLSVSSNCHFLEATYGNKNALNVKGKCNDISKIIKICRQLDDISRDLDLKQSIDIVATGDYFFHVGLGTHTAILLACIELLMIMNKKPYTEEVIIQLSGRGGTSGIGIKSYFTGGFVFDLGRKKESNEYLPSSFSSKMRKPTTLITHDFPEGWKIGLIIPYSDQLVYGDSELEFFKKACPISSSAAHNACYISTFIITSSIIENDYINFCDGVNALRECEWKKLEINNRSANLSSMLEISTFDPDCYGMSSFGPSIYFFHKDADEIAKKYCALYGGNYIPLTICNSGRTICLN